MPTPSQALAFGTTSPNVPAAPTGDQNSTFQGNQDGPLLYVSAFPQRATPSLHGTVLQDVKTVGAMIDGGSSTPTTGLKVTIQVPFAGTIIGWSVLADVSGSASVEIWKVASSAPPSAPVIPTSGNKISASAPVSLSSAQSAAVASSGVSTWTTSVAAWDVFGFNLVSASTLKRLMIELQILRS
jgi:hypothetical protein